MPFVDNGKNLMLTSLGDVAVFMSLHTAQPNGSGSNEVSGGSPAYARKACVWAVAASGERALNANVVFNVPPATTVTHVGVWSAVSAGTFYGYMDAADEAYVGQGTYTVLAAGTKLDINDS